MNNNASNNNRIGIYIYRDSNNNIISNNYVYSNSDNGIRIELSSNNIIYNNYFNNTNNAYDNGYNSWNITKTSGTNIIGGKFLGGNYWNDYNGNDSDYDGIGETNLPYTNNIWYSGDWLPLVYVIDNIPPIINITSPKNGLYLFGRKIITLPFTIIIGSINIEVNATDGESGINRVEFYVNNILKYTKEEIPYTWLWNETIMGKQKLKTIAYDNNENNASDEIEVIIINRKK
jgi:parallel beta-helix repeat protein